MKKDFIFSEITKLRGVGPQLSKYLKKKRIEKVKDIVLNLPYSETDRSKIFKLNELEVGKIQSVKVLVKKLNFPRIRNLPNKILCEDDTGKIDIVYFNSREGYIKKLFKIKLLELAGQFHECQLIFRLLLDLQYHQYGNLLQVPLIQHFQSYLLARLS